MYSISNSNLSWLEKDIEFDKIISLNEDESFKLKETILFLKTNLPVIISGTVGSQSSSRSSIRKIKAKVYPIPFDLDYHTGKGKFFICLGLLNRGQFKAVYKQIQLPSQEVEAVGKQVLNNVEEERLAKKEIKILMLCKNANHLVQLHYGETYESKKKGGKKVYKRVCHFYKMGDLRTCKEILSKQEKLLATIQIIRGLMTLHRLGIIHRDVKPANILLEKVIGPDGKEVLNTVIADMGLACQSKGDPDVHAQSGSPMYMSPQCLKLAEASFDDDVWSFGVLLSELFFNASPMEKAKDYKELLQIAEGLDDTKLNPPPANDISIEFITWSLLQPSISNRMMLPKALNILNICF